MLSRSRLSLLRSLRQKKGRREQQLFVAEGSKLVLELLASSFRVETLIATPGWLEAHAAQAARVRDRIASDKEELARISSLVTPQDVLAVVHIPRREFDAARLADRFTLVLDGIRDPGNMGTIIRIADWFGISDIICSPDSAETWNPKVVQASMGSITRVQVYETALEPFFASVLPTGLPVYGTFLGGKNIYETTLTPNGLLVIGNEGSGIRPETEAFITEKITIPSYASGRAQNGGPESLNAAIATAVACAEFRRQAVGHGKPSAR